MLFRSIVGDKSSLEFLHTTNHFGLTLYALRSEDKRKSPVACQFDGQRIIGDRLHDSRNKRDIQLDAGTLIAIELDERSLKRDVLGSALFCCEAGNRYIISVFFAVFAVATKATSKDESKPLLFESQPLKNNTISKIGTTLLNIIFLYFVIPSNLTVLVNHE